MVTERTNWNQAPAWAQYHAFDRNGNGWWFECRPTHLHHLEWRVSGKMENSKRSVTDRTEWRQTLVNRPAAN